MVHQACLELLVGNLDAVEHSIKNILKASLISLVHPQAVDLVFLIFDGPILDELSPDLDLVPLFIAEQDFVPHHGLLVEVKEELKLQKLVVHNLCLAILKDIMSIQKLQEILLVFVSSVRWLVHAFLLRLCRAR